MDAPGVAKCPYGHRPYCWPTGWAFYLRLFLLSRKAITATSRLPKDINSANIPVKIDIISYAVIDDTSFPMYSPKGVTSPGGGHSCHECFPVVYFTAIRCIFQLFWSHFITAYYCLPNFSRRTLRCPVQYGKMQVSLNHTLYRFKIGWTFLPTTGIVDYKAGWYFYGKRSVVHEFKFK